MLPIPARVIATSFSIIAFMAAIVVGWWAGNSALVVMGRAMVVMALCYPIGRLVGHVAAKVIEESIEQYRTEHPIPEDGAETAHGRGHRAAEDLDEPVQTSASAAGEAA